MKKLLQLSLPFFFLFLFLLSSPSLFAYAHWEGYCQQGGQLVVTNSARSTTQVQQSYPLATLTVYVTGSSPLTKATLYSDNNGTPLGNPLTCSKTGYFSFYALTGTMDLTFSGAGVPTPFTWGATASIDVGEVPLTLNVATACGAFADGAGSTGTDQSTAFQNCVNKLHSAGGGGLFIPYAPLCYWVQNITVYSDTTLYSDSQATCIQYPAGAPTHQMFLIGGNATVNNPGVNIHFYNFTIDGNKANLTLTPDQNGITSLEFGYCTNCSARHMVLKNAGTDNIELSGAQSTTYTATVNVTNPTASVSAATCANGGYTTFTVASHGVTVGASFIGTITGATSGWNITTGGMFAIDASHISGFIGPCPSMAYVSGGTLTYSPISYLSGTNFTGLAFGLGITVNAVPSSVEGGGTITVVYPFAILAPSSGSTMTWNGLASVSDNIDIADSEIFAANRNNISIEGVTHLRIQRNHIYGATGILSGPWRGIDEEPFTAGQFTRGLLISDNDINDNQGEGISLGGGAWYDPMASPTLKNNTVHNNGSYGVTSDTSLWPGATNTLTIDGDQYYSNSGGAAIRLAGYPNAIIQNEVAIDAGDGIALYSAMPNTMLGSGFVSGGSFDLSCVPDGNTNIFNNGATLAHSSIQGSGCPVNSEVATRVDFPNGINFDAGFGGGLPYFTSMLSASMVTSHYLYVGDNAGVNPSLRITDTDHTKSIGNWSGATTYSTGNIVFYQSNFTFYTALMGSTNENPSSQPTFWRPECVATQFSFTNSGHFADFQGTNCATVLGGVPDTFAIKTAHITVEGDETNITDGSTATWGATVAGSGSNHVKIRYNGTNWTVVGK